MAALKYWVWLSALRGIGAKSTGRIIEQFGSARDAFFADEDAIEKSSLTDNEKRAISDKSLRRATEILDRCTEEKIRILTISDAEYPERLKNIFDPPILLYVKGNLPVIDEEAAIAIVGTRSCTPYGIRNAERIGYEIAKCGGVVVTGLARGIDSAAAVGAIRAGGRVIGVLGNGVDVIYPKGNEKLYEDVCAAGGLISEYPPKTEPYGKNFPIRNRIISGISNGVLLIEAPKKSGALITAAQALEQGRDVFVLPGNVDADSCAGSNQLLREGATAIMTGADIIDEYESLFPNRISVIPKGKVAPLDDKNAERLIENELGIAKEKKKKSKTKDRKAANESAILIDNGKTENYIDYTIRPEGITDDEYEILKILDSELQADEIVEKSGLPAGKTLAALTILEIQGYIVQEPGKYFARK